MGQRILVTGCAGFIGSHTVEGLLLRGRDVTGLDNLNDYYSVDRKRANLQEVMATGRDASGSFSFVEADIRDTQFLKHLFSEHEFDVIVHLAALAGVRASVENPASYFDVNLNGTLNLLELARAHRVPHFVFASTSSVYGQTAQIPFQETDACDRPLSPYAASKRAGELLGHTYHHLHGLSFTALRFFTVYGPRGRPDMMAYKLLDNLYHGKDVQLYNNGEMFRDWTYISDIVSGVLGAVDRRLGYEVINLGRGSTVKLSDFVSHVERITGRRTRMDSAPAPAADVSQTYADTSKARHLLSYEPSIDVHDGVQRFVEWYQDHVISKDSLVKG